VLFHHQRAIVERQSGRTGGRSGSPTPAYEPVVLEV